MRVKSKSAQSAYKSLFSNDDAKKKFNLQLPPLLIEGISWNFISYLFLNIFSLTLLIALFVENRHESLVLLGRQDPIEEDGVRVASPSTSLTRIQTENVEKSLAGWIWRLRRWSGSRLKRQLHRSDSWLRLSWSVHSVFFFLSSASFVRRRFSSAQILFFSLFRLLTIDVLVS